MRYVLKTSIQLAIFASALNMARTDEFWINVIAFVLLFMIYDVVMEK